MWFHSSADFAQPGGGQCVGDLRLFEGGKRKMSDVETMRQWRQWHFFFYHLTFGCKQESNMLQCYPVVF